jgi:hypothetical protein
MPVKLHGLFPLEEVAFSWCDLGSDPSAFFPAGVVVESPNCDTEDMLSFFEQVVLACLFFNSCNLLFKKTVSVFAGSS